jgi:hypothetical protein
MISRKDLLSSAAAASGVNPTTTVREVIALAWYRREDYPKILDVMADRSEMHDTYDEWLPSAERVERYLVSTGENVVRAFIDPEAFRAWCEQRGLRPVADTRTRYAIELAKVGGGRA